MNKTIGFKEEKMNKRATEKYNIELDKYIKESGV